MLIKITKQEALDMLLDESMGNKVYFKEKSSYEKAIDYRWLFGVGGSGGVSFSKADFYKEIDE